MAGSRQGRTAAQSAVSGPLENVKNGKPPFRSDWLRTQEDFHIRRDTIVALVIGERQGEWAIARR